MAKQTTIENPTAAELINYLSSLAPDTPIRIEDTDTEWIINRFHIVESDDGAVYISGLYSEMTK